MDAMPLRQSYAFLSACRQLIIRQSSRSAAVSKPLSSRQVHTLPPNDDFDLVTLRDGRDISLSVYGDKSGFPIFYFHGLPGSRLEGSLFHEPALELGAKIISVDRPGVGYSSPHPQRTLLSDADDVKQLAKRFDAAKYSIIGVSAGGSYALACAHQHPPDALRAVALVCALGPFEIDYRWMLMPNRILFWCCRNAAWLVKLVARISLKQLDLPDEKLLEVIQKRATSRFQFAKAPEKDAEVMMDPKVMLMFVRSARQFFRNGVQSFVDEGRVLSSRFGFRLQNIETPMRLWYGGKDKNVPVGVGRIICAHLQKETTELMVEEEQGHVSMAVNCRHRILKDLLEHSVKA